MPVRGRNRRSPRSSASANPPHIPAQCSEAVNPATTSETRSAVIATGGIEARGPAAPFALGSLTGLLPCPLVYSFLLKGLATGSVLGAMGTMAVLGFTSAPALLLVVATGALVSPLLRRRIVRVAGVVVIVLGLVTLVRGLFPDVLHRVFGHGPMAPPA